MLKKFSNYEGRIWTNSLFKHHQNFFLIYKIDNIYNKNKNNNHINNNNNN